MTDKTIKTLNRLNRDQQAWVLHGSDPAWQLRQLQRAIRQLIKENNYACPVCRRTTTICTCQAEWHVKECPFGWVLGGPDYW